ncbi:MAG: helix-turn-helix domain-containing protein [Balneola sp.]
MPASKDHLEPDGFKLFRRDKTGIEIAELLGVSEQTVSKWRKKFNWDQRRRDWRNSNHASIEDLQQMREEAIKNKDSDGVWKIQKTILAIDGEFDRLAYTIEIMDDFMKFVQNSHPDKFESVHEILPDFIMSQGDKYRKS